MKQLLMTGKISLLTFWVLCSSLVFAQQNPLPTPGRHLDSVTDYYGHRFALGEIAINDTTRAGTTGTFEAMIPAGCTSGYFQLWLEPGCGFEGTDPVSVDRLNVLCRVFQDLSSFISSPLTTTGGRVNIWVRKMSAVAGGPFIGVATSFFVTPASGTLTGIADNSMWITINSGVDAYTNVASPLIPTGGAVSGGSPFFHGLVAFDTSVNWNTDLSTPPGIGEMDLYTVALHEAMHALGFMTLIDFNGASRLGTMRQYYGRYDQFLKIGVDSLIAHTGSCSMYDWGFNSTLVPFTVLSPGGIGVCPSGFLTSGSPTDSTPCGFAVEYVDGIIANQPVYTPLCYEKGSSLSHFEDECLVPGSFSLSPPASDNHYFVMSNAVLPGAYVPLTYPGPMKRFPQPEERQVLCDLGYRVDTLFGDSVNLNFHHYTDGMCNADPVVGINDGILPGGAYSFMTTGTVPVDINAGTSGGSLLDNDVIADSFKCLEVVFGSGTFSGTTGDVGTVISFTPGIGTFGVQLFRYIPYNSATGVDGNITYVYAYVGDSTCGASACDLVSNGGFESVSTPLGYGLLSGNVRCWDDYCASPDIFDRDITAPVSAIIPNAMFFAPPSDVHFPGTSVSLPNDHFIGVQSIWISGPPAFAILAEAAQTGLTTPLINGQTYYISCWAKMGNNGGWPHTFPSSIQFAVDTNVFPLAPVAITTGLPTGVVPIWDILVTRPDTNWHYFNDTFTYSGVTGRTLIVTPAPWLNSSGVYPAFVHQYLVVDDISIRTNVSLCMINIPDTICVLNDTMNLNDFVSCPGGIFTWSTDSSGTTVVTHDTLFVPSLAYIASLGFDSIARATVCYDYTDILGCPQTICQEIVISPVPDTILGDSVVCVGSSITLADSTSVGTWVSGDTTIATINMGTGVLTGVSGGVVTISYGTPDACYAMHTVTVNALPDSISGADTICTGGATITLSSAPPGGTWTCTPAPVATIDPVSGILTSGIMGVATLTYTIFTGCYITTTVMVAPGPTVPSISAADSVMCIGDSIVFTNDTLGGYWSSSDDGVATVSIPFSGSGILITGVSPGTAVISYTVSDGCNIVTVTKTVTVYAIPTFASITGALGVCSGYTTTLVGTPSGGVWSGGTASIATIDPLTGVVTGVAGGSVTISYTYTNPCGSITVTANVLVNMEPYITTNFIVACQSLPGPAGDGMPSSDDPVISGSGCMLVCDSTIVRYYANGVAGSAFTWNIFGGTIITTYPPTYDSIDVMWSTVGLVGSIVLYDTFHHCTDSASACIKVIDKPDALFSSVATDYCIGSNVIFTDLSTGDPSSPIVYWHWDFGDGAGSSGFGTAEHTYTASGTYTVKLTVKNQCNCMDSFTMKINISEFDAPDIACPAVVCDSEYAVYSTSSGCTNFLWSVSGGTLFFDTLSATTYDTVTIGGKFYTYAEGALPSITVRWDNAAPDGFGVVTLLTPGCGRCDAPTTIKVPVILQNAPIAGSDTICAGTAVAYSLPLWSATDYQWGVLGNPGAVLMNCRDDHMTELKFATAGTYTVHARYQNKIKLCGGNVFKVITVQPPSAISGPVKICAGTLSTYTLSGGYGAEWELSDYTGLLVASSAGVAVSFAHTFLSAGTYLLRAAGAFCADPLTIRVVDIPPPVDSLKGEDTVCLGRIYSYKAGGSLPGYTYQWEITGGTLSPATGSDIVTVEWTSSGIKQIKVRRVSITSPFCSGPYVAMSVIMETVTPNVTGNTTPCANSYANYSSNYFRGEVYDWNIYPNTVGSVVTGNHAANSRILWNNVAGTATASVVVTVRRCDTIVRDTLVVTVNGSPTIHITTIDDTICAGTNVGIFATSGADIYEWDFGDGVTETTIVNNTSHVYTNTTSGNVIYHITVTPSSATGSCMLTGIGDTDIVVLPSIVAHIVRLDTTRPCPGDTAILRLVTYGSIGIASYSWVASHAPLDDSTYLMYSAESVTVLVTATNGCLAEPVATLSFYCDPYDTCTVPATGSSYCNYITFTAPASGSGTWLNSWSTTMPPITGNPGFLNVDFAGIYSYYFTEVGTECHSLPVVVTVNVVPKMKLIVKCGVSGIDSLFLNNLSSTMPGITGLTVTWEDYTTAPPPVSITPPFILVPSGTTKVIRLTLTGTLPDGVTPFTCYTEQAIHIPPVLTATFTIDTTPSCEKVPVLFDPTVTGVPIYWHWDFDDGSTLLLEDGKREFTFDPLLLTPNIRNVLLTIRDSRGCIASHSEIVEIFPNNLTGDIGNDTTICSSSAPFLLYYNSISGTPTWLEWSNGDITTPAIPANIFVSGAYWVTVHDVHRCQATVPIPAVNVTVIQTPVPEIRGPKHYCVGDNVVMNGYAGSNVQYRWYRGGIPTTGWGYFPVASFTVGNLDIGPIVLRLDVRIYDTLTSTYCFATDMDTIYVHALPAPPIISGPVVLDCDLYQLRLTASSGVSGTFNWSNGTYGPVNDIFVGGPYRVWFTDLYGCKSKADKLVPLDPNTYQAYFPNGCYEICKGQMPLTLNGPPCASFTEWAWVNSTGVLSTDVLSGMDPYTIITDDKYQWKLDNGLCSKTIGTMNLSTVACNKCQGVSLWADVHCDSTNPGSYSIDVSFTTTYPEMTYVLGTDLGPITPFTGTLTTVGTYSATLTFTTMSSSPLPDSVTVQLFLTTIDGKKCYDEVTIALDTCWWVAERGTTTHIPPRFIKSVNSENRTSMSALLVFPNPSDGNATIQYNYGTENGENRHLVIYDIMGRKMAETIPDTATGTWQISAGQWASGMYTIRMESEGHTLQTQRMILTH